MILLKFLPPLKPLKYEIISSKTPLEIYNILQAHTKAIASSFDSCDFVGKINFPDFQIKPHAPFMKASSTPTLNGKIFKQNDKATVFLTVDPNATVILVLGYIMALIALFSCITIAINDGFGRDFSNMLPIPFVLTAVSFALTQFCFYIPVNSAINKLKSWIT